MKQVGLQANGYIRKVKDLDSVPHNMAATASTMLDLTNKATNLTREISSGWYKASHGMDLFPFRLAHFHMHWKELWPWNMAATASTMLDLTNKATNLTREISSGWYKASHAMDLFPFRLAHFHMQWKELWPVEHGCNSEYHAGFDK
jgi:hypothetical protein